MERIFEDPKMDAVAVSLAGLTKKAMLFTELSDEQVLSQLITALSIAKDHMDLETYAKGLVYDLSIAVMVLATLTEAIDDMKRNNQ